MSKCHAKLTHLASGSCPDLFGKEPDGASHDQRRAHHRLFQGCRSGQGVHQECLEVRICGRSQGVADFKLPPSEVAVHPSDDNDMHEFYLMTDDLDAEIAALKKDG